MTNINLKHCPHCGGEAQMVTETRPIYDEDYGMIYEKQYAARCDDCGATGARSLDVWTAVDKWNDRALADGEAKREYLTDIVSRSRVLEAMTRMLSEDDEFGSFASGWNTALNAAMSEIRHLHFECPEAYVSGSVSGVSSVPEPETVADADFSQKYV